LHSRGIKLFVLVMAIAALAFFYNWLCNEETNGKSVKTQQEFVTIYAETPYDAIYQYYKALEGNNWDLVKSLTTKSMWNYIEKSGFRTSWERKISEDPTLKFLLFIVKKQSIDEEEEEGWVMGKVDWTSQRRNVPDDNRIVYVEKDEESWVISRILTLPAVEVVDDFYEAIGIGDFARAETLTTRKYWKKLVAAGIIDDIQKERLKNLKGLYVVFLVEDFSEKPNEAWVSGDVTFHPLERQQREVSVNVHVVRENKEWKIDKIVGHWDIAK
jgi:hypothetical protein